MRSVFRYRSVILAALAIIFVNPSGDHSGVVSGEAIAGNSKFGASVNAAVTPADKQNVDSLNEPSQSAGFELTRAHLRELMPVLDHLRTKSPQQYEKAIRDLDRSAKRLESIKRRDVKLFEISLREWQTRGQIDLLSAKLRVKKSERDQQVMLELLQSLRDTELERVQRELALVDEREVAYKDRIRQMNQFLVRSDSLRQHLNEQQEWLETAPIEQNSQVYLKAIGAGKNTTTRPTPSSKSKLKKATNE